ncbi:MAG: type II toxin-antitoxin system Phd/YefM family antitoxin [Devosia sp.]
MVRSGGKPAGVLMSLEDFASYQETAYLMSSPANRKALMESLAQFEAGKLVESPFPK